MSSNSVIDLACSPSSFILLSTKGNCLVWCTRPNKTTTTLSKRSITTHLCHSDITHNYNNSPLSRRTSILCLFCRSFEENHLFVVGATMYPVYSPIYSIPIQPAWSEFENKERASSCMMEYRRGHHASSSIDYDIKYL